MTTFGADERATYPLEGQVYYVADAAQFDRTLLNRMINSSGTDHADAVGLLSGYSVDEALGYPWSASSSGLSPILEAFNSLQGDHAMVAPSENLAGYVSMPLPVNGYPRYGSVAEVLLTLSAGGITVDSNAVAGGAVWRWTWNQTQFLSNHDYGRLMYLRSTFNHFWTYDAPSKSLNGVTGLIPNGCTPDSPGYVFAPHFGGAILTDAAGDNAMGMYGADDANGGSVNLFNLSNFVCNGDGPAETAFDTVALAAVKGGEGGNDNNFLFPAGESTYNVYIIYRQPAERCGSDG